MDLRPVQIKYSPPGETIAAFFRSEGFIRGIMGPLGSGKSTACVAEILYRAQSQAPSPDGIRRTRWAIIRNSYPELKSTTLKTWQEWCPPQFGKVTMDNPFVHHVKYGDLDLEVLFMALDRPEDARKLLSLELTGAWINEAREVPKQIIDALTGRVGRFPSKTQGGPTWSGIIMDTNPSDNQNWWYKTFEIDHPDGWDHFRQPSGLSPRAENVENLPKDYYKRMVAGKEESWVKVYVEGEYGFLIEGKPVFPMYKDAIHCADHDLGAAPGFALVMAMDFGLTPAAVIAQSLPDGRMVVIDEVCTDNTGIVRFGEILANYIAINYPDHHVAGCWADPAGDMRGQTDIKSAIEIMNENSPWKWRPAPGDNTLPERLEVVRSALERLVDGNPGLLISPKCQMLRKGFTGGYHYKLISTVGGTQTQEKPNKNEYSHIHDALQYLLLGCGEMGVVMNKGHRNKRSGPRVASGVGCDVIFSGDEPPRGRARGVGGGIPGW